MGRLFTITGRTVIALLLALGAVSFSPSAASACACGAVVDASGVGKVKGETALIHHDGTTEQIDMVLTLSSAVSDAAWVMPTPQQTQLGLGDKVVFEQLAIASAPRVDPSGTFQLRPPSLFLAGSGGAGAAPTGKPPVQVDKVTDIGPFRVTTLSGSDPGAVNGWLTEQGYPTKPEIVPILKEYLDQRWVIQAVKLVPGTAGKDLGTELTPLRMTFPTDKPVYPIRLSQLATQRQAVTLYLTSPTPLTIDDQAAPDEPLAIDFAGRVPASTIGRSGDDLWLTTVSGSLTPEQIAGDFTFKTDPELQPYQRVIRTGTDWGGVLTSVSLVVVVLGLLASIAVGIVLGVIRLASRSAPVTL